MRATVSALRLTRRGWCAYRCTYRLLKRSYGDCRGGLRSWLSERQLESAPDGRRCWRRPVLSPRRPGYCVATANRRRSAPAYADLASGLDPKLGRAGEIQSYQPGRTQSRSTPSSAGATTSLGSAWRGPEGTPNNRRHRWTPPPIPAPPFWPEGVETDVVRWVWWHTGPST